MTKAENITKKALVCIIALFTVLFTLPLLSLADGAENTECVYISVSDDGQFISDKNGNAMAYTAIPLDVLSTIDLDARGLGDYKYDQDGDGKYEITALHLYIYVHEQFIGLNFSEVTISGGAGSIYFVGGIFGFSDENLRYNYNGAYPANEMGWGITADQLVLSDGDFLDVAHYSDWMFYADSAYGFHYFTDENGEISTGYAVDAGAKLSVKLTRVGGGMGMGDATVCESYYNVYYGNSIGNATGTVTTDGDGVATLTFSEAGTYYVWCDGGEGIDMSPGAIVSSPACATVTVNSVKTEPTVTASGSCGENVNWTLMSDGTLTVSGSGSMYDYEASAQPWYSYTNSITKIVVTEGVNSIGRCAFHSMTAITELILPESLMAIDEYAFYGCTGITEINVPAKTFYVGKYAFRKTGADTVSFASSANWSFTDGTVIDMNDNTALVSAFTKNKDTYSLSFVKTAMDSGNILASGTFGNNGSFSWTLTDTGALTVNGNGKMPAFNANTTPWYAYKGVVRTVTLGEGITALSRCAFHSCRAIMSVSLPNTLEAIGAYAFYNCATLKNIAIPEAVTKIESFAFRKCASLAGAEFGISYGWSAGEQKLSATELTSMSVDALTKMYYKKTWERNVNAAPEAADASFVAGGACNSYTKWQLTYIDEGRTQMKLTVSGNGIMPEYGTAGAPWFEYAAFITEIEVTEGVTTVGRCAFYGLKFVEKVTLCEGINTIGDYAFNTCRFLDEITLPSTVTAIGKDAFAKTGLDTVPTV